MKKLLTTQALFAVTLLVLFAAAGCAQSSAAEDEDDTATTIFKVEGMTCGGCETGVELAVEKLDGVTSADASYEGGSAAVTYDPGTVTPAEIAAAIEKLGYEAEVTGAPGSEDGSEG